MTNHPAPASHPAPSHPAPRAVPRKSSVSAQNGSYVQPKEQRGETSAIPGLEYGRTTAPPEVATSDEALKAWLLKQGVVDVHEWGEGNTKNVGALRKEVEGNETSLEVWQQHDGTSSVMRVIHVLRGKVCTPESYAKNTFVCNTWQQFGDGRRRDRNALMSEKLTVDELPILPHLCEVCERALAEEMFCVVDTSVVITKEIKAPEFRDEMANPPKVVDAHLVEHIIEIEDSPSFPGLSTMYHIYTVDIVCSGLPSDNFHTLEYKPPKDGKRALKYIHAWDWLEWSTIQQYLLQGSECRERIGRDSFQSVEDLDKWLRRYNIDTSMWGTGSSKPLGELFSQIESEETGIELWSKREGGTIIVRSKHVLRAQIFSRAISGRFLLNTWQHMGGRRRQIDRLLTLSMRTSELELNRDTFPRLCKRAVDRVMQRILDSSFSLESVVPPLDESAKPPIHISKCKFVDHHYEVDESPSFPGLLTQYHFYTAEIECEGLPTTDFVSVRYETGNTLYGWSWKSLQGVISVLTRRIDGFEQEMQRKSAQASDIQESLQKLITRLTQALEKLSAKTDEDGYVNVAEMMDLFQDSESLAQQISFDVNNSSGPDAAGE